MKLDDIERSSTALVMKYVREALNNGWIEMEQGQDIDISRLDDYADDELADIRIKMSEKGRMEMQSSNPIRMFDDAKSVVDNMIMRRAFIESVRTEEGSITVNLTKDGQVYMNFARMMGVNPREAMRIALKSGNVLNDYIIMDNGSILLGSQRADIKSKDEVNKDDI